MRIYRLLSYIFPKSFVGKILFVAFIGTHIPLVATLYFLLVAHGGFEAHLGIFANMIGATLVGTAATLMALNALLKPLYRVHRAMAAFESDRTRVPLETGYRDQVGEIMEMTDRLIATVGTDLRQREEQALRDPLTKLLNRRGFARAMATAGPGAVIYADLDHFKSVNDTYGHDAGDRVLRGASRAMGKVIREGDVTARFGGEEFVCYLPNATLEEACEIAERARRDLAAIRLIDRPLTASFGVALLSRASDLEETLKRADRAVYRAKAEGRNRVVCDPPLTRSEDRVTQLIGPRSIGA